MKKILIGIPTIRYHKEFWESLSRFLPEIDSIYNVEVMVVRNQLIDDARNQIADFFMSKDFDYLLFLDDDHSGHSLQMFNALMEPGEYICAIKCYSRGLPHISTLMDYSGVKLNNLKYEAKDLIKGYDLCDLVGFGMTLIKRELFDKIEKPYFKAENNMREDNYFCDKIQAAGVKPLGCFDHVLTHDGIDDRNVNELNKVFYDELIDKINKQYPDLVGKQLSLILE